MGPIIRDLQAFSLWTRFNGAADNIGRNDRATSGKPGGFADHASALACVYAFARLGSLL
jgi:hypothetical protein